MRLGDFVDTSGGPDAATELCGIFSASDALDVESALDRVQDALDADDGVECVTAPTVPAGEATDVPEDFLISGSGSGLYEIVLVTVPADATHLFIAPPDEAYGDNSDPEPDFSVIVVPEPSFPPLLGPGIGAVLFLSAQRRRRGRASAVKR